MIHAHFFQPGTAYQVARALLFLKLDSWRQMAVVYFKTLGAKRYRNHRDHEYQATVVLYYSIHPTAMYGECSAKLRLQKQDLNSDAILPQKWDTPNYLREKADDDSPAEKWGEHNTYLFHWCAKAWRIVASAAF